MSRDADDPRYVTSQDDLALALGCSKRTAHQWLKKGMPGKEDGCYSIPACVEWLIDRTRERYDGVSDEDISKVTLELKRERKRKLELHNAEKRGELVNVDRMMTYCRRLGGLISEAAEKAQRTFDDPDIPRLFRELWSDARDLTAAEWGPEAAEGDAGSESLAEQIEELRGPGKTYTWIAEQLGVSRDLVEEIVRGS